MASEEKGMPKNYIVAEWPHLTTAYPERIMAHSNKQCVQLYGEHNELKVGFGIFCGVAIHRLRERMEFPWVPGLLHALILFFHKPENVTCWKKWIKYCWLELKEETMLEKGLWQAVDANHLWVMRTFDGKFMIWTDKNDLGEEVVKESLKQYLWDSKENCFLPYEPKPMSYIDILTSVAYTVRGSC